MIECLAQASPSPYDVLMMSMFLEGRNKVRRKGRKKTEAVRKVQSRNELIIKIQDLLFA